MIGDRSYERIRPRLDRALAGEEVTFEETLELPGGGSRIVIGSFVPDRAHDEDDGVFVLVTDVSELRAMAGKLEEAHRRLQSICDHTHSVVYLKDLEGRYLTVNRRFETLFDVSADEVVGQTDDAIFPAEIAASFRANDRTVAETGEPGDFEELAPHPGGPRLYVSAKFPLRDEVGDVYAIGGISTDISVRRHDEEELRRLNESLEERVRERTRELERSHHDLGEAHRRLVDEHAKLVQAEKLSSVGTLAAGVAHEIKNPLMGAIACLDALRGGQVADERRETYFETASESLERIQQTVQSLLDYARPSEARPVPLPARDLVASCLRLAGPVARSRRITLENRVPDDTSIRADRTQLMQAVINLVLNALDAVDVEGRVEVALRAGEQGTGLAVSDDGTGIPAGDADRVPGPVLHDEARGGGHGPGSPDHPRHRTGPWRRSRDRLGGGPGNHDHHLVAVRSAAANRGARYGGVTGGWGSVTPP